jgi:hypothetical protein
VEDLGALLYISYNLAAVLIYIIEPVRVVFWMWRYLFRDLFEIGELLALKLFHIFNGR